MLGYKISNSSRATALLTVTGDQLRVRVWVEWGEEDMVLRRSGNVVVHDELKRKAFKVLPNWSKLNKLLLPRIRNMAPSLSRFPPIVTLGKPETAI
jgi:hypothetical protein